MNKPAFPTKHANLVTEEHSGMSKRELYAAFAMNGLLADGWEVNCSSLMQQDVAKTAFALADAMLRLRKWARNCLTKASTDDIP